MTGGRRKKCTVVGKKIEIMDTTLRDGEQTEGVSYNTHEKLNLAKSLLQSVRVDRLEATSARISAREFDSLRAICDWATENGFRDRVEVLGFVDGKASVDWLYDAGCRVMNLLTKGSRKHCETQLGKSLAEHIADIKTTVEYARSRGVTVNIYLEDWSNGIRDSEDYVLEITRALAQMEVRRIMLPDTLGVFTPDDVRRYVGRMLEEFPDLHFDFHPHNDYGLATANIMTAAQLGVKGVHCTVNCMGERAGNADLAQVCAVLRDKLGLELEIQEKGLTNISRLTEIFSGKRIAANAPVVGKDVFTQTAGVHADGDKKGNLYFNALLPERFGRSRAYALGKMSGKASLEKNLEALDIHLSEDNRAKLLRRIVELADQKKTVTPDDLPFLIADVLETEPELPIRITRANLTTGLEGKPRADIEVVYREETHTASAEGEGAYDAFIAALRSVFTDLEFHFPTLTDYEVHIPPGGKTSALVETVITWELAGRHFHTTGLHSDQNIAAIRATEKALNLVENRRFGKSSFTGLP